MPTIVGILTFMSRINFSLSGAEHEKDFITSGPGLAQNMVYTLVIIDMFCKGIWTTTQENVPLGKFLSIRKTMLL